MRRRWPPRTSASRWAPRRSDVALETADVALLSAELLKLPYAIRLARATVRNVKTNVALSLVLKAAFLVLAVTGIGHAVDGRPRRHRRHGDRRRERAAAAAIALTQNLPFTLLTSRFSVRVQVRFLKFELRP